MILDKVLLLKGLGGLSACAGIGCGGLYLINPDLFKTNEQILAELISKVGLDCKTPSAAGRECTKVTTPADKKINIKQSNEATGKFEIDTLPASSGTPGKIKVYTNNSDYNKGFKFVIEDGNITKDNKTLEQFETYEIKQDDGDKKWYLTRKNTALEEKKRILGLPNGCSLPTNENDSSTCSNVSLTSDKLKAINFEGKDANGASITNNGTVTLTITKVPSSETEFSTENYKFSFNPTEEVTISTTPSNKIAKNSGTEFKIKKAGNKLTLEKAWTADALAKKAGLTGCDSSTKECTLPTTEALKLYISNNSSDKITNGKVTNNSQKIKYEEDKEGYNQGFKFFAENEITLANGNSSKKIEASTVATYEIRKVENEWYLAKKSNGN